MKLYPYQEVAAEHLRSHDRAALFLDMGLGKTCSTLIALDVDRLPALVVAPKRVAEEVWPGEAEAWRPDISLALAAGSPKARADALRSGADIVVIGRDNLKDVPNDHGFKTVVMDELSSFKNRGTSRWKQMKRILRGVDYRWGLTGTPTPNSLLDLWPQMFLLDDGERLGTGITKYRSRFFDPGRQLRTGVITEWKLKAGAEDAIHELVEDICLSMSTEGRVPLPPVTTNVVPIVLPDNVMAAYRKMARDLVLDLREQGGEVHSAANAAVLSSKLSQLTAGFMFHDEADLRGGSYEPIHSAKVDVAREIVDSMLGSPVLVFYRFRPELAALRAAFPEARLATERGVIADWNEGRVPVLLAHPASAGHGLNLQHGGHTVIWTTPTWSLEEYMQANKRLARNGQKHPVVIHHLIAPGTVDTAVLDRLDNKRGVHEALMNHLESVL